MTLANWRDIALLLLVVEALLGSVLILILTLVVTRIVRKTDAALRDVLRAGQAHAAGIEAQTDAIARQRVVRPVARVHAAHAGARAFLRSLAKNLPLSPD